MPVLPLASGEGQRSYGRLPRIQLRNLFPEPDTTNGSTGVTYMQRPGLAPFASVGSEPIEAVWRQAGTFNGDYLVKAGSVLYRVSSTGVVATLGSLSAGRAQVAANATRAIMVVAGTAYSTTGTSFTTVAMPDGQPVGGVAFISGFFILTVEGGQRFYWIEPGQTNPDPLSFAEAERSPDPIVSPAVVGDELWFLGSTSEEVWTPTTDIDAPFQRTNGRVYENGCIARDTVLEVDTQLIWVAADYRVVVAQGAPQTISTPAITEHLRAADPSTLRAWVFRLDAHVFYVLTSDRDTFALDLSSRTWMRFSSVNSETWRAHLGADSVAGDSQSGALWKIDPTRSNDGGENMVRTISAGIENPSSSERCDSVSLRAAVGWSPSPGFEPRIEMRFSDNEGATWTVWRERNLGNQGQYDKHVVWRKMGRIGRPGRIFEFRMTDDAMLRISAAFVNEAYN